jgi:hypothetical protein
MTDLPLDTDKITREDIGVDADYPEGSVLVWERTFLRSERQHTYVALKTGDKWYVNGANTYGDDKHGMTFEALIETHLLKSDVLLYATDFQTL